MKSPRLIAALAALTLLLLIGSNAFAAGGPYLAWIQGFETDTAGWTTAGGYGTITQVSSGSNGVTSASGSGGHAEVSENGSGPFTRFGGYRSIWPGTWIAEIDVYLDPAAWDNGDGFDYSVATSGTNGGHRRDFIFHVEKYAGPNLVVAGSNNTNYAPKGILESGNHFDIAPSAVGWYTLQHRFYDVGGVLHVDLNLLDDTDAVLFTETRTTPTDTIPAVVGGNRYGWFTYIDGNPLAIDNHSLNIQDNWNIVTPANVGVDWFKLDTRAGGDVNFVTGPVPAPSGVGSLEITTTDQNGGSSFAKAQFMHGGHVGVPLSQIDALSYFSYRSSDSTNSLAQVPSLNLTVDFVGDGSSYTQLVYEPVYQPGGVGAMSLDTWQFWDAYNGGNAIWWSSGNMPIADINAPGYPGMCSFSCYLPWSTIVTNYPNAKIHSVVGFNAGSGWAGEFIGNVDGLTFGVSGVSSVYDFEPMSLYINDNAINMHGLDTFQVPVILDSGNNDLSSTSFTVAWDQACLAFDSETDSDNNGVPDSITGLPSDADFAVTIERNGTDPAVTILIIPDLNTPPLPVLANGNLAVLEFDASGCVPTPSPLDVTFSFPTGTAPVVPSFGNNQAQSVDGATDGGTVTLTFNQAPTTLTLDDQAVDENEPTGTSVGTLCTQDDTPDGTDCAAGPATFTYSLVTTPVAGCTSSAGNFAFEIGGTGSNELLTKGPLNHEAQETYDVCVQSTDAYDLSRVEQFLITVVDLNEAPTDIGLNSTDVDENAASAPVGTLSTVDEDDDTTHVYTECPSSPSAEFEISGTTLQTAIALNSEAQSTYNVCIRSTDTAGSGLWVERTFTITVDDVNDAPVANDDPASPPLIVVGDGTPVLIDVLANDTDQDVDTLSIESVVDDADHGATSIILTPNEIQYVADGNYNGPDTFTYRAQDPDGALSNAALVSLNVVANDARGDCNADGQIDAADFPATILEIFDSGTEPIDWWKTYMGTFAGSPLGCDSNASENGLAGNVESVTAADITCTVLIFFGDTSCTAAVSSASVMATSTLILGEVSDAGSVAVTLETAGNSVAAATFALTFDGDAASFDPTDSDGNGVPDAITLNVPASMAKTVIFDAENNRIQVAIYGASLPMPVLSDGVLATVNLQVNGDASALSLTQASLGSDAGQSIPVDVDGNTAPTQGDGALFLPLLGRE